MARLGKKVQGPRLTDLIGLGVLTQYIPIQKVEEALEATGRQSQRQRQLPARVMVYYVLALALYMEVGYGEVLRCLIEGLARLGLPVQRLRQSARSSISQARQRLGPEPLKLLYETLAHPIAQEQTQGAFYRQWRLVSLDGSTLDLPDTQENEAFFGRPGSSRGQSGFPQLRFVALVENGPTFCSVPGRESTGPPKRNWPRKSWLSSRLTCCAWQTADFSAISSGSRPPKPGRRWSGASKATSACRCGGA